MKRNEHGDNNNVSGTRSNNEVFTGSAKTNCFDLVIIELIALEYVANIGVEFAGHGKVFEATEHLKRRIKLKEWFWPELTFIQLSADYSADLWISYGDETTNVRRVVTNDISVSLENVHEAAPHLELH